MKCSWSKIFSGLNVFGVKSPRVKRTGLKCLWGEMSWNRIQQTLYRQEQSILAQSILFNLPKIFTWVDFDSAQNIFKK